MIHRQRCRLVRLARPATLAAFAALAAAATSRTADAQTIPTSNGAGFDTHLFRPAMDSKGLFTVNGSDIIGKNDISFGLVLDYGHDLLRTPGGSQLIDHSFQGTFQFNYGLFNVVVVGLDLPVDLMSGGQQLDSNGQPLKLYTAPPLWGPAPLAYQGLAFAALHAKWRITKVEHGFGLALGVQVGDGFSDAAASAGADSGFWYWPQLILEKRLGPKGEFRIAVNAGYRGHSATQTVMPLREGKYADGSLVTYGGGVSLRILEPVDLVAETYGTYLLASGADSGTAPSNEVVGGLKLFTERNSYLMLGAGTRYTAGFEAADIRGFLGFIFEPSIGDRDGDGIKDDVDQCPDDPEDFDGFKDEDGCPDPDNDNDGIPDKMDRCPNDPEDKDGFEDQDGCPDPDNDHDGIADVVDKCPNEPETFNGFEDEDGCPDKGSVIIQDNNIIILDKIQFAYNSAEILPASNKILDAVSTTLAHHPEFTLVEVAGHADERGGDAYNLKLTQDRVNSVVRAMVARGIDKSRVRSKGYGEYCPIDEAHHEGAWEQNRRVEFKIAKTKDGPTGVELGCANATKHGVSPDPIP